MITRSPAQIEASRRNGAASRGPVTPEGKARSSRNGEKHGMTGHNVVLRNESTDAFDQFLADHIAEYQPASLRERNLVEDLVVARWRLNRILTMETAALDHAMDLQREETDATYAQIDQPTRASRAFTHLGTQTRDLANYNRYEARLRRTILNAEARLEKYEKCKSEPKPPAPGTPKPADSPAPGPDRPARSPQSEPPLDSRVHPKCREDVNS